MWDVRAGPGQSAGLKATATLMGHSNIPLSCDVSADGLSFLSCHKGFGARDRLPTIFLAGLRCHAYVAGLRWAGLRAAGVGEAQHFLKVSV